jgi:succinate dehydrogenase/fumarate reductase cytochrome b subunit
MENLNNQIVKTGDWFVTLLIAAIPVVGLIMLFVWAFGGGTNPSKANWAKAALIWFAVIIVFYILIALIFGAAFFNVFRQGY